MSITWYKSLRPVGCTIPRTAVLGHREELVKPEPSRRPEAALHNHGFNKQLLEPLSLLDCDLEV